MKSKKQAGYLFEKINSERIKQAKKLILETRLRLNKSKILVDRAKAKNAKSNTGRSEKPTGTN